MDEPVTGHYYATATGAPQEATVRWTGPGTLEVEVGREVKAWSVRDRSFRWEISASALRLSYGRPPQVLVIREAARMNAWMAQFQRMGVKRAKETSVPWIVRIPLMLPLGFIAVCVAVYLWALPFAAERLVTLLPTSVDVRLGDAMYQGLSASLDEDTARSVRLQRFGDRLRVAPTFAPRYHVVNDAQVNAFALPGGNIVVYAGLLDRMASAGQLAALLAHEGTHVEERHSTRSIARDLSGRAFLAVVLGDAAGFVGAAAGRADELRGLRYSRTLESEADAIGMQRMAADSVDPRGMVDLLELLQQEAGDAPEEMAFLSTHPLTKERIAAAEVQAGRYPMARPVPPALDSLFRALVPPVSDK